MIKTFAAYFSVPKITMLNEGGNVRIVALDGSTIQADKLDLTKHSRTDILHKLLDFFHVLNLKFEEQFGKKIWTNTADIDNGHIFNGSSEHFFNQSISDEEFVKYKPKVGDVDVAVPDNLKDQITSFLNSIKEQKITSSAVFLGSKQEVIGEGHQTNSLVRINDEINIQIDFEFAPYNDDKPSKFAKFSHSADWEDLKQGFKGVLHKYLIQSIAGSSLIKTAEEAVLFTKAATVEKPRLAKNFPEKGLSFRKFSVGRGLRADAYQPVLDAQGNPIKMDGKVAYKERPTSESNYIQDPEEIAKEIFGTRFKTEDLKKFGSFIGVIDLINKYMSESDKNRVMRDFEQRLFGAASQGFERNNPEGDYIVKRAGFQKLNKSLGSNLPDLPESYQALMNMSEVPNELLKKVKDYYENYTMSGEL